MAGDLSNILISTEPTILTTGWGRTEGPVWHPQDYLTFMDLEGSRLLRWDTDGRVSVARQNTGEGNGCTLDRQGRLIMCEGADHRCITRLDERCFQEEQQGAICHHRKIRAFDVAPDGTLSNNRIFCDMSSADPGVPDGMKVDTLGRVFCVGSGGFWVIEPSGEVVGVVRTAEVTRNLAFGGPDFRTLYMTPGSSLWKMEVKTPGIGAF